MYEIGTKEGRLSTMYSRNQFVICKERFLEVDDVPHTKISLRGQHGNLQIWVIRATIDVYVYKNVKHGSASVKQRSGYVHQYVTEAVHATISDNKIKKTYYIF
jgi:hypothetical protein